MEKKSSPIIIIFVLTGILQIALFGIPVFFNLLAQRIRRMLKTANKNIIIGTIAVLSALLLMGCAKKTKAPADDLLQDPKPGTIAWGMKYGSSDRITTPSIISRIDETLAGDAVSDNKEVVILGTGASTEHWDEATDPVAQKSLALLLPADDEYDFKWANDHESSEIIKFIYARDAKANEEIFGYPKPTEQELYAVLESNKNISPKYKEFIRDFIHKFLTLYPETDFSVFKHNLETLVVDELTEREIQMKAMSFGTVACYLNNENTICVRQDNEVMDTTTNDYVVLTHELMHACRICRSKDINGKQVNVKFYDDSDMGLYEDEALIPQFAYEMQGLGNKSIYYTFQTNIYRQMLDGMDYDGADYMNHSVNYFFRKAPGKV